MLSPFPSLPGQILNLTFVSSRSKSWSLSCKSCFCLWVLCYRACCLSFPLPVNTSKYDPRSQGFLLIPSATFIYFPLIQLHFVIWTHTKHAHKPSPARYLTQGCDIKIDDLIACGRSSHFFSSFDREKATGQIPALQTAVWEEEEAGGEGGF